MGVVGTAMASAFLVDRDRDAGAAALEHRTVTTAPRGAGLVQAGPELALPAGFTYHTFGSFGSAMTDGFVTPPIHDGMAAFDGGDGTIRLVRNHELGEGNDIPAGTVIGDPRFAYDRRAPGGTVTLVVDAATAELRSDWISLNGTDTNCAGMPTPWGTWLTCEETVAGVDSGRRKPHGYVFEVDAFADAPAKNTPYKAMGRFLHEAGAVDPETGVVYMTEDEGPDGFYRFVPADPENLAAGGRSRCWRSRVSPATTPIVGQTVGERAGRELGHDRRPGPVERRGRRLERVPSGSREGRREVPGRRGRDLPRRRRRVRVVRRRRQRSRADLPVHAEHERRQEERGGRAGPAVRVDRPRGARRSRQPDHEPRRGDRDRGGREPEQQLRACAQAGRHPDHRSPRTWSACSVTTSRPRASSTIRPSPTTVRPLATGSGYSEFAGPTFSPDGQWLFVNIQVPGITCAITGPWADLGL